MPRGGSPTAAPVSVRSSRNAVRNASHSATQTTTHGSTMSAVNRPKEIPAALKASRLVRFDTGSSSDPLLARRVHAYRCGRPGTFMRVAVVSTTGVSRTTVASRVRVAVTAAASATTSTSSRCGSPRLATAARAPR